MIVPEQMKAARGLIGWSQEDLAEATSLGIATVKRIEGSKEGIRGRAANLLLIEKTFEDAGVIFIPEDESGGPGVRLKKSSD